MTTKKVYWPGVVKELLWFLSGDTNISYLQQNKVRIWNEWADENGDLGPVYGKQWRKWEANDGRVIDQIDNAIKLIKHNPDSRRIIVSAWNVGELDEMALMPCHFLQFYINDGKLYVTMQRMRCVPWCVFNISSYDLLFMIAQICNLSPGEFIWFRGIVIFTDHIEH